MLYEVITAEIRSAADNYSVADRSFAADRNFADNYCADNRSVGIRPADIRLAAVDSSADSCPAANIGVSDNRPAGDCHSTVCSVDRNNFV